MSKVLMVQGTMSNVGKSLICAGLCRIFAQDGYKTAPFKSQNMALNSYITEEGLEMGRAQVMQAEAAGVKPLVCMNPILLKPTTDMGSQVIVNGEVIGNMPAKEYFEYKKTLIPQIKRAFKRLEETADIIVVEGAGSPAEINLKDNDIVNMGLAELIDAPVLLVGDIDRGGVFAQLLGTLMLLTENERNRVKGLIINKFRGDKTILDTGILQLKEKSGIPIAGVVPYMNVKLEDEDSLTARFDKKEAGKLDIAVIKYPRISNFTDFAVFEQCPDVSVRYVDTASALGNPDIIFLPGTKNTVGDMQWIRDNGLENVIKEKAKNTVIFGICGGFQMLGVKISDSDCVEGGGDIIGMGFLPIETYISGNKTRTVRKEIISGLTGTLSALNGYEAEGYEIHMGITRFTDGNTPDSNILDSYTPDSNILDSYALDGNTSGGNAPNGNTTSDNPLVISSGENIYGTYLHGIFDGDGIAAALIQVLARKKGVDCSTDNMMSFRQFKETQYDELAGVLRKYLDMTFIYSILNEAGI